MLLEFDWTPIRERDADGRLTAAGLQWTEQRRTAFGILVVISAIALIGAVPTLLVGASGATWGLFTLVACAMAIARLTPARKRALIFHEDGRTSAPFGFAHHPRRYREVYGTNANVVSIEARGHRNEPHHVAMYARNGDVAYVAGRLESDNAHRVAVQLTLALAELRESLGERPASSAGAPPAARRPAEALID